MLRLRPFLGRLYSTTLPPVRPPTHDAALLNKAPLAVRERRARAGDTELTPDGLTPNQHARYERLVETGKLSSNTTPLEWISRENARRQRIRGIRTVNTDGGKKVEVVGQPIYLPNVKITLVRNSTPPNSLYNPYYATFLVPLSLTKLDMRSYLQAAYGVATTYIRTSVWHPPLPGRKNRRKIAPKLKKAYKRAVVGLVDPFYFPNLEEDLTKEDKDKRAEILEEQFQVKKTKDFYRRTTIESRLLKQPDTRIKDIHNRTRDKILHKIAERRAKREGLVSETVETWRQKREAGESISLDAVRAPETETTKQIEHPST